MKPKLKDYDWLAVYKQYKMTGYQHHDQLCSNEGDLEVEVVRGRVIIENNTY